ncbi:unnamed protein product [Cylicostephanus goldi]|uniref:Uncharacterized protein n=1 Tax=Cylicostephanus goldi TaxID=71465 RepID=A0A3P6RTU8_CYLGO|nr:unnamed protein product [Cylicostephanus goldi]
MHSLIVFFAAAATVTVYGQQQSSGYENAELIQPAPPALSAENGDQQAYNSDAFVAPASPSPPPPPSPPPYASSAPPASYNTPVSGYATSQPPAS